MSFVRHKTFLKWKRFLRESCVMLIYMPATRSQELLLFIFSRIISEDD